MHTRTSQVLARVCSSVFYSLHAYTHRHTSSACTCVCGVFYSVHAYTHARTFQVPARVCSSVFYSLHAYTHARTSQVPARVCSSLFYCVHAYTHAIFSCIWMADLGARPWTKISSFSCSFPGKRSNSWLALPPPPPPPTPPPPLIHHCLIHQFTRLIHKMTLLGGL